MSHDLGGLTLIKSLLLVNHVEQITPRDQLHDDVVVAGIFHELKDSGDMWMHGSLKHLQLISHKFLVNWSDSKTLFLDNFDGASDT